MVLSLMMLRSASCRCMVFDASLGAVLQDRIAAAQAQSPLLHLCHLWTAMLACVVLPLSSATSSIAFFLFLSCGIVRFKTLCPIWAAMFRSPLVLVVVGFLAWSGLSLSWTVDPAEGWETLRAQRYVLLVPLLLPLARDVRWLVLALLGGVILQVGAQIAVYVGAVPGSMRLPWHLNGGFSKHPSAVSMWTLLAIGAVLSRGLALSTIWRVALGLVAMLGLLLSGSRTGMAGLVALLPALLIFGAGVDRKVTGAAVGLGLVLLSVVVFATDLDPARYVRKAFQSVPDAIAGSDQVSSASIRWALWTAGADAGLQRPVVGWGLGSAPLVTDQHESMAALRVHDPQGHFIGLDMHSSWLSTFVELGVVGVLLYGLNMVLVVGAAAGLSRGPKARWVPLAWSVAVVTVVFGVTNVMFNSGQFEAVVMMGVVLLLMFMAQKNPVEQAAGS